MARTLIASDDFNRASIGANWTQLTAGVNGSMAINASTEVYAPNTGANGFRSSARWAGAGTFSNDQYSSLEITLLQNFATDYSIGVIARASADVDANRDYYEAVVLADSAGPNYTTVLAKVVNGTFTSLHSAANAWTVGDRIEIECEGTTIRLCKNGSPLGGSFTVTDSAIASGKPGIMGAGGATVARGDNWQGGDLTSVTQSPRSMNLYRHRRK
jgi:hypothetical protein